MLSRAPNPSNDDPNMPPLEDVDGDSDNDGDDSNNNANDIANATPEERIQQAITSIKNHAEQGIVYSIRKAAKAFGVPCSTLQDRYNGKATRAEAHAHQQNLVPSQEDILVQWIKAQAQRGIPLSHQVVIDHASEIAGKPMGSKWIQQFLHWHPDLKIGWSSSLEECRARALNPKAVDIFFNLLEEIVHEKDIPPKNIYNADEKGIQLGVGEQTKVLVDCNQKSVQSVEHGNRELVTVMETVCTNGTVLPPSVIFRGKRQDLEWGRVNPSQARFVSVSENGWTDAELGFLWLSKDFGPLTTKRNLSGRPRLLILDGHNSHCTHKFCAWAAKHKIEILCLPSHTTHALQPCDALVTSLTQKLIPVDKFNLLEHYATARNQSFKRSTILAAFCKTGIYPLDRSAIPESAFEPAKVFATQAAPPIPIIRPSVLVPVTFHSNVTLTSDCSNVSQATTHSSSTSPSTMTTNLNISQNTALSGKTSSISSTEYHILLPPKLKNPSRKTLEQENQNLRQIACGAGQMLEAYYAQLKLMEIENAKYRNKAFAKKKTRTALNTATARHLTSKEMLDLLAQQELKKHIEAMTKELRPKFKRIKKRLGEAEKALKAARKKVDKDVKAAAAKAAKAARAAAMQAEKEARAAEQHLETSRVLQSSSGKDFGGLLSPSSSESELEDENTGVSLPVVSQPCPLPRPLSRPLPCPLPCPLHPHFPPTNSSTSQGSQAAILAIEATTTPFETAVDGNDTMEDKEMVINVIKGHRWAGRWLQFEVLWEDGDTTWEKLSNVEDCAALDKYLQFHGVRKPQELAKAQVVREI
ncbi:hypothetical protein D9757_010747 [Collybiopsis confluens]|uniref:HTH CENPB-type domain-containing protein n=1 Tax=Collybiopsis confluens TaxID=2823264 RepID=A0A8H5H8K9_9AGAR|nr:hypothetical protein D9757_010747 [Collybiopsis confluens]